MNFGEEHTVTSSRKDDGLSLDKVVRLTADLATIRALLPRILSDDIAPKLTSLNVTNLDSVTSKFPHVHCGVHGLCFEDGRFSMSSHLVTIMNFIFLSAVQFANG
jgi:hypothetical protein